MVHAFALLACLLPADAGLAPKLAPLAKAHQGDVAVAVKHLGTGEAFFLNADEPMPTASLIKVAVLVELYLQADEGKVHMRDLATLKNADKVPGSGILTQHFSEGAALPLRDCARLMCVYSDNTATNLILDKVGIKNVNDRMGAMGLKETRINAKVYRGSVSSVDPARTKKYGLGSTTAREMVLLFEKLHTGDGFRPPVKLAMLEHLKKNDDDVKFGRLKLPGVTFAHKDGSVNASRTNAGIMYSPSGPIALCVLTDNNKDRSWGKTNAGDKLCADVARAVYDYFHSPKKDTTP
jgi:beta-lactamase class A